LHRRRERHPQVADRAARLSFDQNEEKFNKNPQFVLITPRPSPLPRRSPFLSIARTDGWTRNVSVLFECLDDEQGGMTVLKLCFFLM
jgi:hypothetical protein